VEGVVFCLTAHNPMGDDVPHDENVRANAALERDIVRLYGHGGGRGKDDDGGNDDGGAVPLLSWWRSFGFHEREGWREDGYALAFAADERRDDASVAAVLDLARKYRQAAIYKFRHERGGLTREVVRVVYPNDAEGKTTQHHQRQSSKDVMTIVSKPTSALAERYWRPSSSSS
jgi:hypothetical protein